MKIVRKRSSGKQVGFAAWIAILILLVLAVFLLDRGRVGLLPRFSLFKLINSVGSGLVGNDLPTLVVDMAFENYDAILAQRAEALETGVFIGNEDDFVSAEITVDAETVPVRLRLAQGVQEHLGENEKWNFDGRTRDDTRLLGRQRFYLLDPADNNWQNAGAFADSLHREGLLANNVEFVNLILNGDDRGIYALVDGFGPEFILSQGREEGVLVEYDVTPFWETMAAFGFNAEVVENDPISNLSMSDQGLFEVDTFRDNRIAEDDKLTQQKNRAINALRGFQAGELSAVEVFDVEKYGRFLALVDLWGASQGVSLTNLRYFFNPQTGLLEPVGFNANPLGSAERMPTEALFNDPNLQMAYAQAAAEFSREDYLLDLEAALSPDYQSAAAAVAAEMTITEPWPELEERGKQIRNSLHPIQPVFASLGSPSLSSEGLIRVDVANVLNLPVEILGFDIDGATFLEPELDWIVNGEPLDIGGDDGRVILPGQPANGQLALDFVRFDIPLVKILEQDRELDFLQEPKIQVATRILGMDDTQLTTARGGYAE